jgi:hypothetical protein
MSRIKSTFATLLLTVIVGIVPHARAATTVEATIVGSSSAWQTLALAAFHEAGTGAGHWTSASNAVNVTDTRVTPVNVDAGTEWIVWNSAGTKVWSYNKVDSVVGVRCYFAQPQCTVSAPAGNLSGSGSQQISSVLWGTDSALPASVSALFTTGLLTNVAATAGIPFSVREAMVARRATGWTVSDITRSTLPARVRRTASANHPAPTRELQSRVAIPAVRVKQTFCLLT